MNVLSNSTPLGEGYDFKQETSLMVRGASSEKLFGQLRSATGSWSTAFANVLMGLVYLYYYQ